MAHSDGKKPRRRRPGGGRKPKLNAAQCDQLRALAVSNPVASLDEIVAMFSRVSGVVVAGETARRYLRTAGLTKRRPSRARATPGTSLPLTTEAPTPLRFGYTKMHRDEGGGARYPAGLTDAEWALVGDLFEVAGPGKPPKYPRRAVVDACCYVMRSGCPWRMVPKDLPPWQDVYAHFRRWAAKGLFEKMHDRLRGMWRAREQRAEEPTAAIIDSQSVKTSPQGGPKGYDAAKNVKGRKRHLVTDMLGLLLAVLVHPADVQDRDGASPLVATALRKYPGIKTLYADSAYAGQCAVKIRQAHGVHVEIIRRPGHGGRWQGAQLSLLPEPPRQGFVLLPKRWIIERTNAWVERPRHLAKDQDRLVEVSTAWIWFAESRRLLRNLAHQRETAPAAAAA